MRRFQKCEILFPRSQRTDKCIHSWIQKYLHLAISILKLACSTINLFIYTILHYLLKKEFYTSKSNQRRFWRLHFIAMQLHVIFKFEFLKKVFVGHLSPPLTSWTVHYRDSVRGAVMVWAAQNNVQDTEYFFFLKNYCQENILYLCCNTQFQILIKPNTHLMSTSNM